MYELIGIFPIVVEIGAYSADSNKLAQREGLQDVLYVVWRSMEVVMGSSRFRIQGGDDFAVDQLNRYI